MPRYFIHHESKKTTWEDPRTTAPPKPDPKLSCTHCGSAFGTKDLLESHRKVTGHGEDKTVPVQKQEPKQKVLPFHPRSESPDEAAMMRRAMAASRSQQAPVSPSSTSTTSATRSATTAPAKKAVRPSSPMCPRHVTVTSIRRSARQLSQPHLPRRRAGREDPTQPSGGGPTLSCCCQYSPTTLLASQYRPS